MFITHLAECHDIMTTGCFWVTTHRDNMSILPRGRIIDAAAKTHKKALSCIVLSERVRNTTGVFGVGG